MSRRIPILLMAVVPCLPAFSAAQDVNVGVRDRGPRFLVASSVAKSPVPIDIARTAVLTRRVSVALNDAPLDAALKRIADLGGFTLSYSTAVIPYDRRIRLKATDITVAAALTEVLLDADVDVVFSTSTRAVLIPRSTGVKGAPIAVGAVVGTVRDAKTGQGVAAVEILLERTKQRTTTDTIGRYRLAEVDTGTYTLITRRLGYAKHARRVTVREGREDTVDVSLEPVAARLDELVTTATGSRRRLELGNDITSINADSLVRAEPIRNVTDILEGRVPGLTVQHTSGAPGDPSRLRLRGAGSPLKNNDPIVVVDGIRIYAQQSSSRNQNLAQLIDTLGNANSSAYRSYATPSPLDQIDPNSIETIEVFKGPSAAALYGEDAANGVIAITTKRGKAGPTRWSFSADYGRDRIPGKFPELFVRWGHEVLAPSVIGFCPISNRSSFESARTSFPCVQDSIVSFQLLNDPSVSPLAVAHYGKASLTARGGSTALTYAVTASYNNETGLPKLPEYDAILYQARTGEAPPDWMDRPQHLTGWGGTSTITARLGPKADLTLSTSLQRSVQQRSSMEQQFGTLMTTYLDKASGKYYQNGFSGYPSIVTGEPLTGGVFLTSDGLLGNYFERATSQQTMFRNAASLSWRPGTLFTLTADAGVDVQSRDDEVYQPSGAASPADSGHVNIGHGTAVTSTMVLRSNMREVRLLPGVRFSFATRLEVDATSIRDQSLRTSNLAKGTSLIGSYIDNNGWSRRLEDQAAFGWYVVPAFNVFGFRFASALQLQQVGSTYGSESRRFLQNLKKSLKYLPPAFDTSFLLSDQPFFPFKDLFQTFRVRVAFGRAGRQPGPADRLRLYGAPRSNWVDGGLGSTVVLNQIGNNELRPERSTELEGGLDADLLNNSLSVSLTTYRKTTIDMILDNVPFPLSVNGGGTIQKNVGKLRNTGLELSVAAHVLRDGPVGLATELQLSQTHDKLLAMAPGVEPFYVRVYGTRGVEGAISSGTRVAAGYPLYGRWALPIVGYADGNGNGVLESQEILYGDTAVYVGQTSPNYTAALRPEVSFFRRAVVVSAGFLYADGLTQQYTVTEQLAGFSAGRNLPGASLAEQLVSAGSQSDYAAIQTVSTFRFNSLSLSYTVPAVLARRLGAQKLRVYVQGTNLGLWSSYRGLDPNVNALSTGNGLVDTGVLPQPRTWQVRISADY